MSQRERDRLKLMHDVVQGERTQAEAARLLGLSVRQFRRLHVRLQAGGDGAMVHRLRSQPSNRQLDPARQRDVLAAYRARYPDFGPTLAAEQLAEDGLAVGPQTLRRWLLTAGLWQRPRRRQTHRTRRPRRACFGELVQMDASIHDWLAGRNEEVVLITRIDDATSVLLARFYPAGTVVRTWTCSNAGYASTAGRWHCRPITDRHRIFEPQDKGRALPDAETQFGRALRELDIGRIRARSPQAKGRVERSFGTAQTAGSRSGVGPRPRRRQRPTQRRPVCCWGTTGVSKAVKSVTDGHRPLGPSHDLASVLSVQTRRVVSNDDTVRFATRFNQLPKPAGPGPHGGEVGIEQRREGSLAIRFGTRLLGYREVTTQPERPLARSPASPAHPPGRPGPRANPIRGRRGRGG